MKAIGVILLTFFQNNFFAILAPIVSMIFWVTATIASLTAIKSLEQVHQHWSFFFIALIVMLYISAANLRRLVLTNAGALLPHYRQKLLIAFGIVLVVFLAWPVVITGLNGFPVLNSLSMFLFIAAALLWGVFNFGENMFVLVGIFWLGNLIYEMLEFKSRMVVFGTFSDFSLWGSKAVFPALLILLAVVSLYLFVRYFLKVSPQKIPVQLKDAGSGITTYYDNTDRFTGVILKWRMSMLVKHNKGKSRSLFHTARLLQVSLFSPVFAFTSLFIISIIGSIIGVGSYLYIQLGGAGKQVEGTQFLLFVYIFVALMMTTDFLQHRHRLPGIWIQAPLNSRKQFAGATILAYLMTAGKHCLLTSLLVLAIPLFFPAMTVPRLLPPIVLGLLLFVIIISLSLLISDQVHSFDCKGWMIGGIIFFGYFLGFVVGVSKVTFTNMPGTWYFILGTAFFSLFLLWRAYKKWSNTEMDFVGPEIISL